MLDITVDILDFQVINMWCHTVSCQRRSQHLGTMYTQIDSIKQKMAT